MILEEAETHLKDVRMPAFYWRYQQDILKNVNTSYQHALRARRRGIDAADIIEPKIAYDLADRVAKMHNIDTQTGYVPFCHKRPKKRQH
jgi:DNA polymerase II large subunit